MRPMKPTNSGSNIHNSSSNIQSKEISKGDSDAHYIEMPEPLARSTVDSIAAETVSLAHRSVLAVTRILLCQNSQTSAQRVSPFVYSDDFNVLVNEHADKALLLEFDDERRRKSVLTCANAIFGIVMMIIENFVAWDGEKVVSNGKTQTLKTIISISTGYLLYQIFEYNHLKARMQISRYFRGPLTAATFIYKDRLIPFLVEFFVCLWHIPPFIDHALDENPDKWGIFMFVRLYLLIRPMRDFSPVYRNRGKIIKSGHAAKGGQSFNTWLIHLRIAFYDHPGLFVFCMFLISYLFLSFSIYVHERESLDNFAFGDSLWYTAITMTTVGYGDIVASTRMGRIVAVMAGVLGIMLSSFCVAVTSGFLRLSGHQKFAVDWVHKVDMDASHEEAAAVMVQSWWRLMKLRRSGQLTPKIEYHFVKNIIQATLKLRRFRRMRRYLQNYQDDPVIMQKLQLEGRFDPVLDRVLRMEDLLNKLDWRLKRIQKNVYGDDIEAADTYRKIYARDSTHRSESVSLPFSPLKKTSLEQRMTRIEETQNQILELLQKQAGGP